MHIGWLNNQIGLYHRAAFSAQAPTPTDNALVARYPISTFNGARPRQRGRTRAARGGHPIIPPETSFVHK